VTAANHNTQTDWQTIRDALDDAEMEIRSSIGIDPMDEIRLEEVREAHAAVARLQHQHEQAMAVVDAARMMVEATPSSAAGWRLTSKHWKQRILDAEDRLIAALNSLDET
jgi:hypothetical protein